MVRCSICRLHFTTLKLLNNHYYRHSKSRIIKCLLKFSVLSSVPKIFHRTKNTSHTNGNKKSCGKIPKTKTLYLNENFHILCSKNEVIIGDSENRINSFFSFDDAPENKTMRRCTITKKGPIKKNPSQKKNNVRCSNDYSSRSTTSSEGSNSNLKPKRKVKRKKQPMKKHYHINITRIHKKQTLDDKTGEFYKCNCPAKNKMKKCAGRTDLKILTSDTESCSDTGKTLFQPIVDSKLFCPKCGNGYKTKTELAEHMYIHETFCRLCNTSFINEFKFREHMRLHIFKVYLCHVCNAEFTLKEIFYKHFESHIEENTLEAVLDMEEEYKTLGCNFLSTDYNASINNILCFLNEYPDMNYHSYRFPKVFCDICRVEILACDYERHHQTIHFNTY